MYIFKRRCIIEIEKAFFSKFNELGSDYYKKLFSALFILLFGFIGIGTSGNIVKASTMVEQTSEMAKTFSQLTPEEQSYFKSKGFSDKDTFTLKR